MPELTGQGLSPHGRGKLARQLLTTGGSRSIPARAGETTDKPGTPSFFGVYPRTGGGNRSHRIPPSTATGLSPHGRGKQALPRAFPTRPGSIPARAGETQRKRYPASTPAVYPRTGGGNSYPPFAIGYSIGLSPPVRGKRRRAANGIFRNGSIPARAGETAAVHHPNTLSGVYPRTGGGNFVRFIPVPPVKGLSPHGRGKHLTRLVGKIIRRSIPARAGETGLLLQRLLKRGVYPRTGGGNQ